MEIDKMREQISNIVTRDMYTWNDVLNNTIPGNYGCENWDAEVDYTDIFVNIQERSFKIKKGSFSAQLVMGASKGDSSFVEQYIKTFSAEGNFEFKNANEIQIENIEIDIDNSVYEE